MIAPEILFLLGLVLPMEFLNVRAELITDLDESLSNYIITMNGTELLSQNKSLVVVRLEFEHMIGLRVYKTIEIGKFKALITGPPGNLTIEVGVKNLQ